MSNHIDLQLSGLHRFRFHPRHLPDCAINMPLAKLVAKSIVAVAATEGEIEASITAGISWLADDHNGNGYGVLCMYDTHHRNYTTGICMMAMSSTGVSYEPSHGSPPDIAGQHLLGY